jgi:hypothetical protein
MASRSAICSNDQQRNSSPSLSGDPAMTLCRYASLREKGAKMIALVREVEAEVSGVDGESARPLNPIAAIRSKWAQAFQ